MAFNSSDVSAGQDGLATQYNNLRLDVREANCDIQTRYYSVSPGDAVPFADTVLWENYGTEIRAGDDTTLSQHSAGIHLPHGAIITSFKAYWHRDDAAAAGAALLKEADFVGGGVEMANADSNSSAGNHSVEDTSITNSTIDNVNHSYHVLIGLSPNNAAGDVIFYGAVITYTIVLSLP